MEMMRLIISPHNDDWVLGLFKFLFVGRFRNNKTLILLMDYEGSLDKLDEFYISVDRFNKEYNTNFLAGRFRDLGESGSIVWVDRENKENTTNPNVIEELFIPSMLDEHPLHKNVNGFFRFLFKDYENIKIYLYSVELNVEWKETLNKNFQEEKKGFLDECFPVERDLWNINHKYWLFEGVVKEE